MKITMLMSMLTLLIVLAAGCSGNGQSHSKTFVASAATKTAGETSLEENTAMKVNVQLGNSTFAATMENNAAGASFIKLMQSAPIVIRMNDYSGFEKVGSLGTNLPTSDRQTTVQNGDIVLYNGNKIVIFYGSHSWSYTRLGKIDDLSGWREALGSGDVTVTFSMK